MGGASGVVSIRRAAARSGRRRRIVACIAGDTNHTDSFRRNTATFSQFAQDAVYPYGSGGPNASFALLTAYYMRTHGATREDFGKLCLAQRNNALKNPLALFKKPLTLDEYLNARLIADPLRLFDCVMPCAGAEGFLVMRRETAEALGLALRPAFGCDRAAQRAFPTTRSGPRGLGHGLRGLVRTGGIGPDAIDFLQCPMITGDQRFSSRASASAAKAPPPTSSAPTLSKRKAPSRSIPRAGSYQSARPARRAAISASSRRSANSPAKRGAPASPMRGMVSSPGSG
jgi:acetyl-CoA acetyltransferase